MKVSSPSANFPVDYSQKMFVGQEAQGVLDEEGPVESAWTEVRFQFSTACCLFSAKLAVSYSHCTIAVANVCASGFNPATILKVTLRFRFSCFAISASLELGKAKVCSQTVLQASEMRGKVSS